MYDELIKKLRKMQNHEYCVLVSIDGFPAMQTVNQAADAIEGLSHAVDQMTEWRKNRWIPVTERLPEEYTWVLVSAKKHDVAFDAFYDGTQWKDAVLNGLIVTHWMPLPEPPKDGE